jgi:immune inhibitor A
MIVHAGPGAEEMDQTDPAYLNNMWSHKWQLQNGFYKADGAMISVYNTVPENCKIGVCAHELGHQLFGW